jgi:type I restriction enzyme R subunit
MLKPFNEAALEQAFIDLLSEQGYSHALGNTLTRASTDDVLLKDDLRRFLLLRYKADNLTNSEADNIIQELDALPASDLYETNKTISQKIQDGFLLKREDYKAKDLYIQLIDYSGLDHQWAPVLEGEAMAVNEVSLNWGDANIYRFVTQLEITGIDNQKRIPDGILYINGLPLVVFEFKNAVREEVSIHEAYVQLTIRYKRDIPALFKYNAFCIISDGANTRAGSLFASYDFYYTWRRTEPNEATVDVDGINSLYTMVRGVLHKDRLRDVVRNFIYLPDSSKRDEKIVCRYPQYYAARALFANILKQRRPIGKGKGGTYFGATGCGKSYTMLFLTRLLMKSVRLASPTIVLITDRTDLDDQLSRQFTNAKGYIGDNFVKTVTSRADLRQQLRGRPSGGVFLTTIHKFNEDTDVLSQRTNVIVISDEAHRSQTNLDQKITVTDEGVKKTYGFAKHLHDSLPNATYVGFTGTPVDATLDVFGEVVDSYTMTESVRDEITVRIVREGRAAKVALKNSELERIEAYYAEAAEAGASDYAVEESKKTASKMTSILGNPERLAALAEDFVTHYENRVTEGATIAGKAMFVCSDRAVAYAFYQQVIKLRPQWLEELGADVVAERSRSTGAEEGVKASSEDPDLPALPRIMMVMTRNKDDDKVLYNLLGTKEHRKELDRQFKQEHSNFKIAIVVDMWLTGFDVPFLDTLYIDKPVQRHNLIQTISRVNRKFAGKNKGLIVDYIGIKRQMNLALAMYSASDGQNMEDIEQSVVIVRDHLDLLRKVFHGFDNRKFFVGTPLEQLDTLNRASEFVQTTQQMETRFMGLVKRLKAAYDICAGGDRLTEDERDLVHFYLAVRSIVFKLTKGDAPDTAQMNAKVRQMIEDALASEGVEELFTIDGTDGQQDIFSDDYLEKLKKIKLPNTRLKLLQQLLAKAIANFKQVNRMQAINFSEKMQVLVARYNDRTEHDVLTGDVVEDFSEQIISLYQSLREELSSFADMGIDLEEKAFYDILKQLCIKYDFTYPEDKLLTLTKAVKEVVDDKTKYTDWSERADIKAELKVDLIILLAEHGYPPVDQDEVYAEVFAQAEGYRRGMG